MNAVDAQKFETERLFNADYLRFMAGPLGDERSDADAAFIWRLLGLEPGVDVLDLACGHGRIANRLAGRGCRVRGLDYTALFLERARADAAERGVDVEYVQGDMRELPWKGEFDLVVSWFTAFGYFHDDGNRQVLAAAAAALRPGGRFVLDLNNQAAIMNTFQHTVALEQDGDMLVDRNSFDPLTGRNSVERTMIIDGRANRLEYFVRLFPFTELRSWLLDAGFAAVDGYGEDGEPLNFKHRRMIVVARLGS